MKGKVNIKYYIKRNKALLTCFALAAFILLVFVLLFVNVKKHNQKEQALSLEEQEKLTDMSEYLNEIDKTVTTNREQLAEASLSQTETTEKLTESVMHRKRTWNLKLQKQLIPYSLLLYPLSEGSRRGKIPL